MKLTRSVIILTLYLVTTLTLLSLPAAGRQPDPARLRAEFLKMCDAACSELNTAERNVPFYQDSYAVRALLVAYDLTAERKYLDVCRAWSNRMLEYQAGMTPKGAYWMHYGRKPGETKGDWFVADCASIAIGVLATAARCDDPANRQRYRDSVAAYAKLVMDNYIRPSGGITDGLWSQFDGEWWCSTGIFGSLAFLLYAETENKDFLNVGLNALDWLNRMDFRKAEHIGFKEAAPAVVIYVFEAFSAGMPYLDLKSPLGKASAAHIGEALKWMGENQGSRVAASPWDYTAQWGSKLAGLPFHQYVYSRYLPEGKALAAVADKELDYIGRRVFSTGETKLSQLVCFAMFSYAEKISPGAIYRTAKR
jgi:hypothetical protein